MEFYDVSSKSRGRMRALIETRLSARGSSDELGKDDVGRHSNSGQTVTEDIASCCEARHRANFRLMQCP